MLAYKTLAWIAVLATLVATATPVAASTTGFAGTAYDNWEDVAPFSVNNLMGSVNWIVYAPDNFPDSYLGSGYTPTSGEFTYVYQVVSTGTDPIHKFSVDVENQADNIGAFGSGVGVIAPTTALLSPPADTYWTFQDPSSTYPKSSPIGYLQSSQMLAFSSPKSPEEFYGTVFDGGNHADLDVLPGPGSLAIGAPEPSTLGLTLIGLATWAAAWATRRRHGRDGL
jgi:hypothetical protein